MPNEHRADPTPPPHHGQSRGGSKKESFSLRVSPALHPPERPSPRHADMTDHGLGRETRERRLFITVSKHNIQPEYGDEQADAGRDCRTCLARPNSPARTRIGKY